MIPTNKNGFSYELGTKLQVPAQGPIFAVAFKELGIEAQLKPIALKVSGMAYRGRSGKYNKAVLPASAGGLDAAPLIGLLELAQSQQEAALKFLTGMALMPEF